MPEDQQPAGFDFEINFNDVTLLEAHGSYDITKAIMERPVKVAGNMYAPPPSKTWVVKSTMSILHELGYAQLLCDFYHDRRIIIVAYGSTSKEIHRPDMRCLSFWAQSNGWLTPEPHPNLIREDMEFWRNQWETHIVESEFFDKKIGNRSTIYDGIEDDKEEAIKDDDDDRLEEEIKKL